MFMFMSIFMFMFMSYHGCFCMCRFQIVDLPGAIDSDTNNGSWRIGDWADTLELPNIGLQAIVRWIPGPLEITGRLPQDVVYACICQSI